MAVTAKFVADFSSFFDQVNKAEVELEGFEKSAKEVSASLSKMADSFSGKKLLQEGAELNRLFQKTEDIALLTDKELRQVSERAAEAAEKMLRLGQTVPQGLAQLASHSESMKKATKESLDAMAQFGVQTVKSTAMASDSVGGLGARLTSLAGTFGIVLSVQAVMNFTKEIIAAADEIQKLSDKTGVNVETLQRFQHVADASGNTVVEMTDAITQMQNRLASGNAGAIAALERLGLTAEELRRLAPEDQFIAISEAIRRIEDPAEQTRDAIDLFGKVGARVLPSIKAGFQDIGDTALVMSSRTIQALDAFGDKLGGFWRNLKAIGGEALADIFTLSLSKTRELQSEFDKLAKNAETNGPKVAGIVPPGLPDNIEAIERGLDNTTQALMEATAAANAYAAAVVDTSRLMADLETKTHALTLKNERALAAERTQLLNQRNKEVVDGFNQIQAMEAANAAQIKQVTQSTYEFQIQKIREWEQAQIAAFRGAAGQLQQYTDLVKQNALEQMNALEPIVTLIGGNASNLRTDTQTRIHQGPAGGTAFSLGNFSLPQFSLSARASGGPVNAGQPYMVGERGPELFVPSSAGTVQASGAGQTQVIQLVVDGKVLAEIVNQENTQMMRRSRIWPSA